MNLSDYRKKKGITQKQLANAIGVTESTISKYEKGLITPPLEKIMAIVSVLGDDSLNAFPGMSSSDDEPFLYKYNAFKVGGLGAFNGIIQDKDRISSVAECPANELYDHVTKNADYQCQLCGVHAPEYPRHFLELYYVNMSEDSETSVLDQFVAVCPNCLKILSNSVTVDLTKKLNDLVLSNKKRRNK